MAKKKSLPKKIAQSIEIDELVDIEPSEFKSLSDADKAFCREYVTDWNGRRAYQVLHPNYTDNAAKSRASEITRRKRIQLYCKYLSDNIETNVGVSKTWVLEQHLKIARSSIAHLHDTWITLTDFDQLTEDQKYCIEEITTQTRKELAESEDEPVEIQVDYVKLKLYNKQKSLDAISAMMGYAAVKKIDVTSGGEKLSIGSAVNVQINVYNSAPPLARSEKDIKI